MAKRMRGIIASYGLTMGIVKRWLHEDIPIRTDWLRDEEVAGELKAIDEAFSRYRENLSVKEVTSPLMQSLREAHIELISDPFLIDSVHKRIQEEKMSADRALDTTIRIMAAQLEALEDPYLRERGTDYRDMGRSLLYELKGLPVPRLDHLSSPCILVTEELAPSEAIELDKANVLGFTSDRGGATSHTSIIAQTLGIPALVGMKRLSREVNDGDFIILDAENGELIINPDVDTIQEARQKMEVGRAETVRLSLEKAEKAVTADGHVVDGMGSIGGLDDLTVGILAGAEGVGLFRTEMLYMELDHFPTEDEQLAVYRQAAEALQGNVLTIRTLDIGGDKRLPYYAFPREANPFLGWRALRFCFDEEIIFRTQLRAILRASAYGNVRLMLPMVVGLDELARAKRMIEEEKEKLAERGRAFNPSIPVGIMLETPAAVMLAEELAHACDFFSIGTNDLTQYILATDRGNDRVAGLHSPYHPAVIRAIKQGVDAAHRAGISCGMCGGFAGNLRALPLLIGLGVDALSVPASVIPKLKEKIRHITLKEGRRLAKQALGLSATAEIMQAVISQEQDIRQKGES